MELERAVEEFLTYLQVELNRSPATRKGYAKDLRIFLKYLESRGQGNICIEQITREHLSDYLRHLTKDRGLRPNTVKRRLTALKSLHQKGKFWPGRMLPKPGFFIFEAGLNFLYAR